MQITDQRTASVALAKVHAYLGCNKPELAADWAGALVAYLERITVAGEK